MKQLTQCLAHSQHCEGFSDYSRTWLKKKKASSLAPVSGDLDSGLCFSQLSPDDSPGESGGQPYGRFLFAPCGIIFIFQNQVLNVNLGR